MGLIPAEITIPQDFFFFPQVFTKYLLCAHDPSTVCPWAFPFSLGEKAKSRFTSGQCWVKCKIKDNLSLNNLKYYSFSKYWPSELCLCFPCPITQVHDAGTVVTEKEQAREAWVPVPVLPLISVGILAETNLLDLNNGDMLTYRTGLQEVLNQWM